MNKEPEAFALSRNAKTGRQGYCKECSREYREKKGLISGVKRGRKRLETIVCKRCNQEKPRECFAGQRRFCNECFIGKGAKKKYTTPESKKIAEKENSLRSYYKNKDRWKEAKRRYRLSENGRKLRAAHMRRYRQTESGKLVEKATKHTRRSRANNGGSFTGRELRALYDKYNNTCLCCECNTCKLTPDHVIPLAKGGSNTIDNIQPLCLPCNTKKGIDTTDYRERFNTGMI
jgi:5-methylcytosine-specific restriction endonuclease McrA